MGTVQKRLAQTLIADRRYERGETIEVDEDYLEKLEKRTPGLFEPDEPEQVEDDE